MAKRSITASLLWDRFGIGVSGVCAVHCLFFPAFLSLLPVWQGGNAAHEWIHPLFIILLVPVIYFAIRRSHGNTTVAVTLLTGFGLVTIGWLFGHFWLGAGVEVPLTLIGSGILIAGHWLNYRHHRSCTNRRHKHHPGLEEPVSEAAVSDKTPVGGK
ncbi:MAG: MerC domain-containing protein [Balneolaceae bacterium]